MTGIQMWDVLVEFSCGNDERAERAAIRLAENPAAGLEIIRKSILAPQEDIRW
jgi:hypothetical protein